jgi:hypothetical protein
MTARFTKQFRMVFDVDFGLALGDFIGSWNTDFLAAGNTLSGASKHCVGHSHFLAAGAIYADFHELNPL